MQQRLFNTDENLLPYNGDVRFYQQFYETKEANLIFEQLKSEIDWKHEPIKIFGKMVMQPRLTAWYGDKGYGYSGIFMQPQPWTALLFEIKCKIEKFSGANYNSVLLNQYRDGKDSNGWHRDNEKGLGELPNIASLNFGATRKFQMRNYTTKKDLQNIYLTHGSLLLCKDQTQNYWEHTIPKTSQIVTPRINLTFRLAI